MEITLEDIKELERLLSLHRLTNYDVVSMENLSIKYIDPKIRVCRHCASQIRFAHKQLSGWVGRHAGIIEEIKRRELQETYQPLESLCLVCGKETKDRRYKYCSKQCKSKRNGEDTN